MRGTPASVPIVPAARGARGRPAGQVQVQVQHVADAGLPVALLLCAGGGGGALETEPQVADRGPGVQPTARPRKMQSRGRELPPRGQGPECPLSQPRQPVSS